MSRNPEPYDQLSQRERDWIDSLNPKPIAALTKEQVVAYLTRQGLPVTFWAVKSAIENADLPSKFVGKARRASEFDALVWAATRDHKRASA